MGIDDESAREPASPRDLRALLAFGHVDLLGTDSIGFDRHLIGRGRFFSSLFDTGIQDTIYSRSGRCSVRSSPASLKTRYAAKDRRFELCAANSHESRRKVLHVVRILPPNAARLVHDEEKQKLTSMALNRTCATDKMVKNSIASKRLHPRNWPRVAVQNWDAIFFPRREAQIK